MTLAEATIAAAGTFFSLTVGVIGWMIVRAVHEVSGNVVEVRQEVRELASRDRAQDLSIADCATRLIAVEAEINRIREKVHKLVDLTAGQWTGEDKFK